jgi:phosphoribosylanthranilate isomerase
MIDRITLKVCGITSLGDAVAAAEGGADYLGFNFYPPSPRSLSLERYSALAPRLPRSGRAAVLVEPTMAELAAVRQAGFDAFQIHFSAELDPARLEAWAAAVGVENLWLAPRLPPDTEVAAEWLPFARTFMLDTFRADRFGGSGVTGDWAKFARHRLRRPEKVWILAGGLNPENIGRALRQSGAGFVDVNSGVESAPGKKDAGKLRAFIAGLRAG